MLRVVLVALCWRAISASQSSRTVSVSNRFEKEFGEGWFSSIAPGDLDVRERTAEHQQASPGPRRLVRNVVCMIYRRLGKLGELRASDTGFSCWRRWSHV